MIKVIKKVGHYPWESQMNRHKSLFVAVVQCGSVMSDSLQSPGL